MSDVRQQQFKKFIQDGLPTRKNELWKYTDIRENDLSHGEGVFHELKNINRWSGLSDITLVFVNGYFTEKLSTIKNTKISLTTRHQALQTDKNRFPFASLNADFMTDGLFLEIPENMTLTDPIHLLFIHTGQNAFMTHPRNIIIAGQNSQVTIVEEHVSENAKQYFTNVVTEIHAARDARVDYYKMQDNDFTATHIANIFIEQQKGSRVKTFSFSKGARLSREDLTVWQQEEACEVYLHGLYVTTCDQQHVDHHVHVDHLAAHGKSSMLYKGVLDKKSRGVFNGKVYVHPKTKQINAHQENHNLLLSKDAEINTKPELEIYAEDVKCTHGATIGQLDHEALFYLLSRGIGKDEAHAMLLRGFTEEIFGHIENETVRHYLQKRMNHHDE